MRNVITLCFQKGNNNYQLLSWAWSFWTHFPRFLPSLSFLVVVPRLDWDLFVALDRRSHAKGLPGMPLPSEDTIAPHLGQAVALATCGSILRSRCLHVCLRNADINENSCFPTTCMKSAPFQIYHMHCCPFQILAWESHVEMIMQRLETLTYRDFWHHLSAAKIYIHGHKTGSSHENFLILRTDYLRSAWDMQLPSRT